MSCVLFCKPSRPLYSSSTCGGRKMIRNPNSTRALLIRADSNHLAGYCSSWAKRRFFILKGPQRLARSMSKTGGSLQPLVCARGLCMWLLREVSPTSQLASRTPPHLRLQSYAKYHFALPTHEVVRTSSLPHAKSSRTRTL